MRVLEPVPGDLADRAVAAASAADVAVVVVGLDSSWETEGRDRTDLSLPGGQVDLVRRVVAANPRTVVVVNAGAPVEMGWVDDEIGRASCRERVCQSVSISVLAVYLKNKTTHQTSTTYSKN